MSLSYYSADVQSRARSAPDLKRYEMGEMGEMGDVGEWYFGLTPPVLCSR